VRTLNLGIVAHVDAGKTTLTERLLHAAGVIDEMGSVDHGSTQTDSMALERQRGITIKSAVVSFAIEDTTVNLIDTPGHPDFIAEVDRALSVLDGAVLVVSAVEGVQAQTRVLMRALRRQGLPVLIFVNKIDRAGARSASVLGEIARRLSPSAIAMNQAERLGTGQASAADPGADDEDFAARLTAVLAERDDELLAAYVEGAPVPYERLRRKLAWQARHGLVYPVFFGSAMTGAGVAALTRGIRELLPHAGGDASGPVSGTVFKVERGPAGERIAYVRMHSGTLRVRDKTPAGRVTAISVFAGGPAQRRAEVAAGQIGLLRGLPAIRTGDPIGVPRASGTGHFAPPTLETVVTPRAGVGAGAGRGGSGRGALHAALAQLAEADPLIGLRQDDVRQEIFVSLYGEVQKEVIQATLASDFGIDVEFSESATICIERPAGSGAAAEFMGDDGNPFKATAGLRVDPAPEGSGVAFRLGIELGALPGAFLRAIEDTVRRTLRQGLRGWQVTDCVVTLTHSGYVPPPPAGWSVFSTAASDFRGLVPLVLMSALRRAGTHVLEPVHQFRLEIPADTLGMVLSALTRLGAVPKASAMRDVEYLVEGEIAATMVHHLERQLPSLTRGEGMLETAFGRYRQVRGSLPVRARTDNNPLDRKEYLLRVNRQV
jgi:ribosomal protection tetracycline resistance protein